MSLRFRRSIRIAKGVRLNFSKSGVGVSAGPRGMKVGIGPRGAYRSIGIPGTGLYDFEYLSKGSSKATKSAQQTTTVAQPAGQTIPVPPEIKVSTVPIWVFIASLIALFNWPALGFLALIGSIFLFIKSYQSPAGQSHRLMAAGNKAFNKGNYESALQSFISVTELFPEAASLYKVIGELYISQKDYENAVSAFEKFLSQESGDYVTQFQYAATLAETERYREAIPILQGLPQELRSNIWVITLLGTVFLKTNQPELALSVLEKGPIRKRNMDTGMIEFRYTLATAYKETGDKKKALREFRKVYAEDMAYLDVYEQLNALDEGSPE